MIVNKFLYPNGGSETYVFEVGKQLQEMGYEVQYFGMFDEKNIVGNVAESYTKNMNFHGKKWEKLLYPFKIVYSVEARKAIRKILNSFQADVVHLNNFNFQITPSIIYEIRKYGKQINKRIKIVFTAHDYQLVCPNHMMRCPVTDANCAKCIRGDYFQCFMNDCIHRSKVKSLLGSIEGYVYKWAGTYRFMDRIICPSRFMKMQLDCNPRLQGKTIVMPNFSTVRKKADSPGIDGKGEYVLYFGRYTKEKGIKTLLQVCRELPEVRFVFAGNGPLEGQINEIKNIENRGFLIGEPLVQLIREAKFSVYPAEWYENCPFSVMESIQYGTPVLGANIGGIPEIIEDGVTGELFESGSEKELKEKIQIWLKSKGILEKYRDNCLCKSFVSTADYCNKLIDLYRDC